MPDEHQKQPYDNVLKMAMEGQQAAMLPELLGEPIDFLDELNVEVLNPPLRADRVYKTRRRGQIHIIHIEFESGADSNMDTRLLVYHAYFLNKYQWPVISIIIYPFKTTMVTSPLQETSGEEALLTFHYRTLPLWKLDAQSYVEKHAVSMYSLLPAMQGANLESLRQALAEMVEYYKGDDVRLARQLLCFSILMRRADLLPPEDQLQIEERLHMYDNLLDEDPYLRKRDALAEARGEARAEARGEARAEARGEARAEARGEARAEARGEVKALQGAVITLVRGRFPSLIELAQEKITQFDTPEALHLLLEFISTASSEETVRRTFVPTAA